MKPTAVPTNASHLSIDLMDQENGSVIVLYRTSHLPQRISDHIPAEYTTLKGAVISLCNMQLMGRKKDQKMLKRAIRGRVHDLTRERFPGLGVTFDGGGSAAHIFFSTGDTVNFNGGSGLVRFQCPCGKTQYRTVEEVEA